jgi:hypothetical protein
MGLHKGRMGPFWREVNRRGRAMRVLRARRPSNEPTGQPPGLPAALEPSSRAGAGNRPCGPGWFYVAGTRFPSRLSKSRPATASRRNQSSAIVVVTVVMAEVVPMMMMVLVMAPISVMTIMMTPVTMMVSHGVVPISRPGCGRLIPLQGRSPCIGCLGKRGHCPDAGRYGGRPQQFFEHETPPGNLQCGCSRRTSALRAMNRDRMHPCGASVRYPVGIFQSLGTASSLVAGAFSGRGATFPSYARRSSAAAGRPKRKPWAGDPRLRSASKAWLAGTLGRLWHSPRASGRLRPSSRAMPHYAANALDARRRAMPGHDDVSDFTRRSIRCQRTT